MLGTQYCTMPDRRFIIEIQGGLMPAGHEYLTNDPVPRPIPPGMYDTSEGYFDLEHHIIIDYIDPNKSKNLCDVFDEMTFLSTVTTIIFALNISEFTQYTRFRMKTKHSNGLIWWKNSASAQRTRWT